MDWDKLKEAGFDGGRVITLGGGGITISTLELIIDMLNREGQIVIMNAGKTSTLKLGMQLAALAKHDIKGYL